MIDNPAVVGSAAVVVSIVGAAAYSYFTGDSAGADIDNDGEAEVTFEDGAEDVDVELDDGVGDAPVPDVVISKDSLTEVKGVGDTRRDNLVEAGFETVTDIFYASDENLTDVDDIGEYTVEQIREDIGGVDGEGE